jgi:hypothetical protein
MEVWLVQLTIRHQFDSDPPGIDSSSIHFVQSMTGIVFCIKLDVGVQPSHFDLPDESRIPEIVPDIAVTQVRLRVIANDDGL